MLLTTDEPEHAYLTDFGVSKRVGVYSRLTNAGQWVGTLDYLSPEQIRGEEVGPAADTYMLAGLLYHCLTGTPPFVRDSQAAALWAHISAPVPAPSVSNPELPHALDAVIARGLAKDPAVRYSSAGELAAACAEAVGLEPLPTVAGPTARPGGEGGGSTPTTGAGSTPGARTIVSD